MWREDKTYQHALPARGVSLVEREETNPNLHDQGQWVWCLLAWSTGRSSWAAGSMEGVVAFTAAATAHADRSSVLAGLRTTSMLAAAHCCEGRGSPVSKWSCLTAAGGTSRVGYPAGRVDSPALSPHEGQAWGSPVGGWVHTSAGTHTWEDCAQEPRTSSVVNVNLHRLLGDWPVERCSTSRRSSTMGTGPSMATHTAKAPSR